ncbi:MAG TPA: YhcH/YjgK/YiaL family protein [Opitutaceae bacterium]|nr:YhcH/YjgK/YiaL family protein [Opitutaceae bacterium]
MALLGTLSTVRAQLARPEHFAASFAYLEECFRPGTAAGRMIAGLAAGQTERIELEGGAFALLQAYLTKPRNEGRWETHRAYIDIQAMIAGEELMEIASRERLIVEEDLTPAKDLIFYHPFEQGAVLRFDPGYVGVYFPTDGHRGGLLVKAPKLVRKVVVKVPVGPFGA